MLSNSLGNWFTLNELGFLSAFCPSRTRSSNPRSEALFFSNLCTVISWGNKLIGEPHETDVGNDEPGKTARRFPVMEKTVPQADWGQRLVLIPPRNIVPSKTPGAGLTLYSFPATAEDATEAMIAIMP